LNFKQFVKGIGGYSSKSVRIGGRREIQKYWMNIADYPVCG
jgi:hypothetical protein